MNHADINELLMGYFHKKQKKVCTSSGKSFNLHAMTSKCKCVGINHPTNHHHVKISRKKKRVSFIEKYV